MTVTLVGCRVFADVIKDPKMRPGFKAALNPQQIKERVVWDTDTGQKATEDGADIRVMQLQAKRHQGWPQPPAAERERPCLGLQRKQPC